jgi:heme/copper-type cytochrome/quinol oxidase subunit 4
VRLEASVVAAPAVPVLFVAIAVIFVSLALRDFLKDESKLSTARSTWLRMAMIFAAVAIALVVVNTFAR